MALTLRKKILMGYGLTLVLTGVVLVWALVGLRELGQASDAILRENYRSIIAAEHMIDALERQDSGILLRLLGYEAVGRSQFQENESDFLLSLGRARDNITIPGEDRVVARIDSAYTAYLSHVARLNATPMTSGAVYYRSTLLPAFVTVRNGAAALRELNQETMYAASQRAHRVGKRTFWSTLLIGLAAVGTGLAFSLFLAALLLRPLREMTQATRRIAARDYDIKLPENTDDELGDLAREFNAMVDHLREFHDLNVRKMLAEKRKGDTILRAISDGIVVVGPDLQVQTFNPAAVRALGAVEQGCRLDEVVNDPDLLRRVEDSFVFYPTVRADDSQQFLTTEGPEGPSYYQYAITRVRGGGDTPELAIILLRDLTTIKTLDRMKSEFIMAASHELKTPLTGMEMSIGLLQRSLSDKLTEREKELVDLASADLKRLTTLVSDLLDLSQLESGKIQLDFESVAVGDLMRRAVGLLGPQAKAREIELSYTVPDALPPVRADRNKITWVLTNLISNALRYTSPGGYIRLSAEHSGKLVQVHVADNGAGIPPEHHAHIFDKFGQVKNGQPTGGSGLGLTICKEILRAQGGTIWVDSEVGKGSTFTFVVPSTE